MLTILRLVESGDLQLLSSEALEFEIDRIPHQHRKGWATEMLKLANHTIELNDEIEAQADNFVQAGIQPMDTLHLASASWTKVDYFCTCDDRLLKTSRNLKDLTTEVISPLQLVAEVAP